MSSLRLLKPEVLRNTLALLSSGVPRENVWQKEFYRVATSHLPHEYVLSAEVGKIYGEEIDEAGTTKAVDFYVDHKLKWMIEFLVEGRGLAEHIDRFATTGRYSTIPRNDWLIVDFRVNVGVPTVCRDRCMYVMMAADYSSARIMMHGFDIVELKFQGGLVRTLSDL